MSANRKRIEFKIEAPEAQQVLLVGNFNNWSVNSDHMKRDKTGVWKKVKMLPHGKYEYKFFVDGQWTLDPNCPGKLSNEFGSENNALEI